MKRKRELSNGHSSSNNHALDTSKPTAVFKPTRGRPYTISLALPGSIIANAQTHDLKTSLAGQIARALAVFCIDEVVIFDDGSTSAPRYQRHEDTPRNHYAAQDAESGYTAFADPHHFLYHLLSYLETPPYLRRALFPHHPDLRTAGSLPSLDMPHHLRVDEWSPYREGVTIIAPTAPSEPATEKNGPRKEKPKTSTSDDNSSPTPITHATAGVPNPIHVTLPPGSDPLPPNVRLTLKFAPPYDSAPPPSPTTVLTAAAVPPDAPRTEAGYFWGYTVRRASSLSAVFEEAPYDDGYDFSIGTSERGEPLAGLMERAHPKWHHMLVVFGGVAGLEAAVKNDARLREVKVTHAKDLFDVWVNLIEGQGSRTIRTEEAVWMGLMGVKDIVGQNDITWRDSEESYAV